MNQSIIKSPDVKHYTESLGRIEYRLYGNDTTYDSRSYNTIDKIFELLENFTPVNENGVWELWLTSERGPIEAFGDYEEMKNDGDVDSYWYIEKEENKMIAHGIVNGHPKIDDTTYINTTRINGVEVDTEKEEAIIITKNTTYHCPLIYWDFKEQDKYPDAVEKYDELKALYNGRISLPEIEHGKVLLVLSDFDEYYFHSLCVKDDKGQNAEYRGDPHIGTFQDSYLISARTQNIDIRYFPHYRSIEFYSLLTNDMPLYIENIGYGDIFIINNDKKFCIHSGERKAYNELTIVEGIGILPDGDLYPAMT